MTVLMDLIGRITVQPALNDEEVRYLEAFRLTLQFDRAEGPYAVPDNPLAETLDGVAPGRLARNAPGQPASTCQWAPCYSGCCLAFDGRERFSRPEDWLQYLIDHFLAPGGVAAYSGDDRFSAFTFDHHLEGLVVGTLRDTGELFAIEVVDNTVSTRPLRLGDPGFHHDHPLPYEAEIDERVRTRFARRDARADLPKFA